MRVLNLVVVFAASLMATGGAMSQETTQPPTEAAPVAEPAAEGSKLAQAPGRLIITVPKEPALPACAAKNNCSKAVADKHNAGLVTYNASTKPRRTMSTR